MTRRRQRPTRPDGTIIVYFRCPADVIARIETFAKIERRTISGQITHMLEEALDRIPHANGKATTDSVLDRGA